MIKITTKILLAKVKMINKWTSLRWINQHLEDTQNISLLRQSDVLKSLILIKVLIRWTITSCNAWTPHWNISRIWRSCKFGLHSPRSTMMNKVIWSFSFAGIWTQTCWQVCRRTLLSFCPLSPNSDSTWTTWNAGTATATVLSLAAKCNSFSFEILLAAPSSTNIYYFNFQCVYIKIYESNIPYGQSSAKLAAIWSFGSFE